MSLQDARAFFNRLSTDEAFTTELIQAPDARTRIAIVNREGLDFTAEHFEVAARDYLQSQPEGPSTERLSEVADVASSLLGVVAVRIMSFYGDDPFFRYDGPIPLTPQRQGTDLA